MARENYVMLQGFVLQDPQIIDRGGENVRASCKIEIGRNTFGCGKRSIRCDGLMVLTEDRTQIEEIKTWRENDIVEIKGVITVRRTQKGSICRTYGENNLAFVDPIACRKLGTCASQEEGLEYLSGNGISPKRIVFLDPDKTTEGPQDFVAPVSYA